ncbi:MAG: hypothetical protein SD837_17920 [Candidatus Electrothrix scaldis]|nr:MAG: hypothetical protein SD837_17920 [Candidatus Electrothrix sp. GW3-3]
MAKQNRKTLKNYFGKGQLPTESQFADLIDSGLNLLDDRFDHTAENGFKITTTGDNEGLFSFYDGDNPQEPRWSMGLEESRDELVFRNGKTNPETGKPDTTLSLGQGRIGINKENPQTELDVNGVISAAGRQGTYATGRVPADGKWHDLTEELEGCQAFEVMAGVGKVTTGKYALLHAIALNAHHPEGWLFNFLNRKRQIRATQSYYRSLRDKLKIRWKSIRQQGRNTLYCMQIRTNSDYGEGIQIQYSLTNLWFDPLMQQSQAQQEQAPIILSSEDSTSSDTDPTAP